MTSPLDPPPSAGNLINTNPELASFFGEYLIDARNKLLQKLRVEDKNCMANHDNAENYAKCMYALQKDMKDDIVNLNFKTTFLKRKMEDCMQSTIYKTNKDEGTKHCIRVSKELIDKLLSSLELKKTK